MYNKHNKDKLLKHCPFCGGKAKLRSPKKLRTQHSAICSDIICVKCGISKASWPWPKSSCEGYCDELPREVQDKQVIKEWNKRK